MSDLVVACDKFLREALEVAEPEFLSFALLVDSWYVIDAFPTGFQQLKEFIKEHGGNDADACCERTDRVIAFYTELQNECIKANSFTEEEPWDITYCASSVHLSESDFGRHLFGVQSDKYPFWPPQPPFFQDGEEEPDLKFGLCVQVEVLVAKALEFIVNG